MPQFKILSQNFAGRNGGIPRKDCKGYPVSMSRCDSETSEYEATSATNQTRAFGTDRI